MTLKALNLVRQLDDLDLRILHAEGLLLQARVGFKDKKDWSIWTAIQLEGCRRNLVKV